MSAEPAPLVLGGAQFGLDYGVSNRRGRIPAREAAEILAMAAAAGIGMIDTAPAYGDSEETVGTLIGADPRWRIVTKTVDIARHPPGKAADALSQGVSASLARLRRSRVDILLFHRAADLGREDADEILDAARALRTSGSVGQLGVSIYDAAELDAVLELIRWDVVQVPLSVIDQRLVRSGHVARLAEAGIEVQARSVFLQGLLLQAVDDLPVFAQPFASALGAVGRRAGDLGISALALCLAFVRTNPQLAACVVGVSSVRDLAQILDAGTRALPDLSELAIADPALVDPRRWPRS